MGLYFFDGRNDFQFSNCTETGFTGGADFNQYLTTFALSRRNFAYPCAKGTTEKSFFYTKAGDPGTLGSTAGTTSVKMQVTTANTSTALKMAVWAACLTSTGTVRAEVELAYDNAGTPVTGGFSHTGTGTKTYNGNIANLGCAAGDRLRIEVRLINTSTGAQGYTVAQDNKTAVDLTQTQISVPWATSLAPVDTARPYVRQFSSYVIFSSGTSSAACLPAIPLAGSLILALASPGLKFDGTVTAAPFTTPTGWTKAAGEEGTSTTLLNAALFYRVSTGVEADRAQTLAWTGTVTNPTVTLIEIANVGDAPFDTSAYSPLGSALGHFDHAAPASHTGAGGLALALGAMDTYTSQDGAGWDWSKRADGTASGYTGHHALSQTTGSGNPCVWFATKAITSNDEALDLRADWLEATTDEALGWIIVIKPAAAAGGGEPAPRRICFLICS